MSNDGGTNWNSFTLPGSGTTVQLGTLYRGEGLLIKGWSNNLYGSYDYTDGTETYYATFFSSDKSIKVEGNIASLEYGDNFIGKASVGSTSMKFTGLFDGCTTLTSAENLVLPYTTANYSNGFYTRMFRGCTNLVKSPKKILISSIYQHACREMFEGCTNLITAPQILSDSVSNYGCYMMFYQCTSLTAAPELPATKVSTASYTYMFYGCTSLTKAPTVLPTELNLSTLTNYSNCYYGMFSGCTSLATVSPTMLPSTTVGYYCYARMFQGCTSLTAAPELPAAVSKYSSGPYDYMFYGCSSLNYVKCSATIWETGSSYHTATSWLDGVAENGTFVGDDYTIGYGTNRIPFGWRCESTHDYKSDYLTLTNWGSSAAIIYFKTTGTTKTISVSTDEGSTWTSKTSSSSTNGTSLGSLSSSKRMLIKGTASTYAGTSYYNTIYTSNSNVVVSGNIMSLRTTSFSTATSISANYAFHGLFYGCKFSNACNLVLPATTLKSSCYDSMFYGCTNLSCAPSLPATTLQTYCYYNMFYGCSKLGYIKCMATTTATNATNAWVNGVSSTGIFVKNKSASSSFWSRGTSGIPSSWTVQTATS